MSLAAMVRMKLSFRHAVLQLLLIAAVQPACDLSTAPPTGVLLPGGVDGPDSLPTRLTGAIGDFAVAYGGNDPDDGFVLVSGLMADELRQTIQTFSNINVDRRAAESFNPLSDIVYRGLQRARASAEEVADAYHQFDPTALGSLYARSLAGFAYTLLAEGFCSAIPVSRVAPDGTIIYGQGETTTEILKRAEAAFDSALAAAPRVTLEHPNAVGSVTAQLNLAHVGLARVLLDLGRPADAEAEAASVPDGFVWEVEYSTFSSREVNGLNYHLWLAQDYSAADSEGVNGVGFLGAGDTRALVDTVSGYYAPLQYAAGADPIVLASTTEARLIESEALLQAGDASASLALLNALRANVNLAPLEDAGSPDDRLTQLFRERAFWLWLTGHRLGDLRRLVRQYGRSSQNVYPTGQYDGGAQKYGDQLDLQVTEINNPKYDPATCDTGQP